MVRLNVDQEELDVIRNWDGREKKVDGWVKAMRGAVCGVVLARDVSGMYGNLIWSKDVMNVLKDVIGLVILAVPILLAVDDTLVVPVYTKVSRSVRGGAEYEEGMNEEFKTKGFSLPDVALMSMQLL